MFWRGGREGERCLGQSENRNGKVGEISGTGKLRKYPIAEENWILLPHVIRAKRDLPRVNI